MEHIAIAFGEDIETSQRDCEAGMVVFFTQLPFANWKKSSHASTERSMREVSKAIPWAKVERHSVYSITSTVTLRKKVLRIKICSFET
jgi:hypothetical protein